MEKNIDYYLKLPYTRELILGSDGIWFIRIKELPGCFSQGKTQEEALRMIDDAMCGWLEVALEDGELIPEPRPEEQFSGKFVVRLPKSLHRKLVQIANDEGVSLNQFVSTSLSEMVGISRELGTRKSNEIASVHRVDEFNILKEAFTMVVRSVCVYEPDESGTLSNFSTWFGQNVETIQAFTTGGNYERAIQECETLQRVLRQDGLKNPLFDAILRLLQAQIDFINSLSKKAREASKSYELLSQINRLISSQYNPKQKLTEWQTIESTNIQPEFSALEQFERMFNV